MCGCGIDGEEIKKKRKEEKNVEKYFPRYFRKKKRNTL